MSQDLNDGPLALAATQAPAQAHAASLEPADQMFDASVDPHAALIAEYAEAARSYHDALGAVVAHENAKLFDFANKLQGLIDGALAQAKSLADLKDLDFALKRRLDLHRQCNAYAQLSLKIEAFELSQGRKG